MLNISFSFVCKVFLQAKRLNKHSIQKFKLRSTNWKTIYIINIKEYVFINSNQQKNEQRMLSIL